MPQRIGIVGAGTIGPDIGYYLKSAIPDLTLVLVDVAPAALERAVARIEGYVDKGLARRKLTEQQAVQVRRNLVTTQDYAAMADCDWVLEAATENLELKRKIFRDIEAVVRPDALITSNTSSLPASRLFGDLIHKRRATVTHFFAPAFRNPAVEVVGWEHGDPEVLEYLRWLFCTTGKVPFVTADALCFMLDRVFDNWCNEAGYLLDRASASEVDSVAVDYVHAGPFFVLNLARGNPIIVETNTVQMEEGAHYRPAPIFGSVDLWKTATAGERVAVMSETEAAVRDRLLGALFSQTVDILDRDIGSPADLNLGCCLALGFKQGPLDLMRSLGDAEVGRILERFARERPGMPTAVRDLAAYREFRRVVLVDEVDGVKVLTIRRPQALNALDDEVTDELLGVIRQFEQDATVRGFVIVGYGSRAFCAGADIGRFPEMLGSLSDCVQYSRDCSRLLVHLDRMTKPVVAALNGMALGGGVELALRCRGIVATRETWLQFPEVTLGIAPGIGGMVVPYRRWPQAASVFHDMLRLGRKLDAARAHALGVVDALVGPEDDLIASAVSRVGELSGAAGSAADLDGPVEIPMPSELDDGAFGKRPLSREVIGIIDQAIVAAAQADGLEVALEIGYAAFGATACTEAAREGVTAFLEKRRPDFARTG
ncbi:MAG: 3-hydroxyacyl-CoA dehydrogenase/enoyl-CoA hydratase family protein [Vicinamibacterales bacterium]|jgi:enoyl-CoA hydratase/3-hydroxyacyl-CoA dehydrogenase|nr:3-hydroxyacyl-CoA dehydrogenase/enoyl-CoA hydratase family protein [Vicinamibacterales bacterium]HJO38212.1 3-hydroxyacyl-CoA dehydrogenase/enoyl-CoA hydratase family protein [Vicinamibacterales bacterium]